MTARHTLYRAVFTPVRVTLPERCPDCNADLTEGGSLIVSNWLDGTVRSRIVRPQASASADAGVHSAVEGGEWTDYGDEYHPAGVACARCDWLLLPDDEEVCDECGQGPKGHPDPSHRDCCSLHPKPTWTKDTMPEQTGGDALKRGEIP